MSMVGVDQISEQCLLLDNGERMFTARYPYILESD